MPEAGAPPSAAVSRGWGRALAFALLALASVVLLLALFPWDWLRGPLNRYVSERTGRHFEITQRLQVRLGRHLHVMADGLIVGNPAWASEPFLVQAERAELQVRLLPLLRGRLELPWVALRQPRLGLELLPDGRRTWTLEREGGAGSALAIGAIEVDKGSLRFIAPHEGADLRADFVLDAKSPTGERSQLPLGFRGGGRWRGESFVAEGRAGNVLALRETAPGSFPAEVFATVGKTSLRAAGRLESLASLDGADISIALRGRNLSELQRITGVALPDTPPYVLEGRLQRSGALWAASELRGVLGRSDVAGELTWDGTGVVPLLRGVLHSHRLDFDDLAPVLGLGPVAPPAGKARPAPLAGTRVLPQARVDAGGLRRMDLDLRLAADRVIDARPLPLERLALQLSLRDAVLQVDPLDLGMAGGRVTGALRLDAREALARARVQLDIQGMHLNRLFPSADLNRASAGQLGGHVLLAGRGHSLAQMLGGASGDVALLIGRGRISNLLLEYAGLDGGEIIKFAMGRDQRIELRCAAAAFDVQNGLMRSRALVLDTADTVIYGQGAIGLADERIDLVFRPFPKDPSILALRSPLKLTGTLGAPEAGADKGAVAARAAIAIGLAMVNPLLGLAATIETGPGKDADCPAVLRQAASAGRQAPASAPLSPAPSAR